MFGGLRALSTAASAPHHGNRLAEGNNLRRTLFTHVAVTHHDDLEITVDHGPQGNFVHLNGRVNFDSSPAVRDRLLALLQGPSPETVIVDLTQVSYFDSSGIATLIEALKIARNRKTNLCLKGLEGRLLHLFEVTGVLALFDGGECKNASSGNKVS